MYKTKSFASLSRMICSYSFLRCISFYLFIHFKGRIFCVKSEEDDFFYVLKDEKVGLG